MTLDREAALSISQALQNIYLGTITVANPYVNQIFQRDTRTGGPFGKGVGNVVLTINPSQPVTVLEHRLRDASIPANIVQDWTNSVPSLAAGSQTVALAAPAGLYMYLLDIRANHDDVSIVSTTHAVMVGELIGFAGQSLAEDMVTNIASGDSSTVADAGLTVSPWNFVFASFASNSGGVSACRGRTRLRLPAQHVPGARRRRLSVHLRRGTVQPADRARERAVRA